MKKKTQFTKRILSFVLSIMMVVSMLPASTLSVFAADTTYPYAVVDTEAGTVTIDGTLGGKTEATEEDITALVDAIKGYVDNGVTTVIVTGETPAMIDMGSWTNTAIGEAIYRLSGSDYYDENNPYNGKIDLILQDVTEIVDQEFYSAWALNSITLPRVIKLGDEAFHRTWFLKTITFESVLTEVNETGGVMFAQVGKEVGGCDLILNCGQMDESSVPAPDLTNNIWKFNFENEFKSITLTHTADAAYSDNGDGTHTAAYSCCGISVTEGHSGGEATCTTQAACENCGASYGDLNADAHSYDDWESNGNNTHTRTCANDSTHTENGDCSGGTATCTTLAVCDTCGVSYGKVDTTNHDETVAFDSNGFCPNGCYEPATLNAAGYYEIDNAGKLFWFAQQVNVKGNREIKGALTAHIDLENKPWTPIGATGEENNNFRGVFDGQNYTIRGLNVEGSENGVGFFGEVRTGTVKNFTIYGNVVVNIEVDYVGGVIGSICGLNSTDHGLERNGAIIQNITSFVNVTAKAHGIGMIGGFVGYANHQSLIEQCAWYGTFDAGEYRVDSGAGGFIGKIQENTSEVTIRNCGAYGTIKTGYEKNSYNNYATIYMGGFLSFSNTDAKTTLENCLFAGGFERGENLTDQAFLGAFGTLRSVNAIKNCYYLGDDGLAAVHSDSNLKPGDNIEITSVTGEALRNNTIATQLGDLWEQDVHYPIPKDTKAHSDSATYTYTDNGDGTHKKTCNECGYVEVYNEAHSGGTATCTEQAECQHCGASYGELGGHTAEPTYAPNAEDSTKHDVTYSCCGTTVTEAHDFENEAHQCICGKVENFTVYWPGETLGLQNGISTYGQTFSQTVPVPENTHLRILEVNNKEYGTPVKYSFKNDTLTIAAEDLPAADILVLYEHYVKVTCHANGGVIRPDDGFPLEGDNGFAEDKSYWVQEWPVTEPIYPLRDGSAIRTGYTFVEWRDESGKVYPSNDAVRATVDVTIYAQWQCNHTIGGVVFRDNGNGTHNGYCGECDELLGNYVEHPHNFGDNTHKCVCGKKVTPEVTAPTAKTNLIYDGSEQELINAGSTTGGTLQYSLDNVTWSAEIPTAITVGTHTVYYKVVGDENYEDVEAQSIIVTITDKTAPTGTILIKENGWNKFWNTITFGIFCKDYVDVTITADGTGSGIAKVEYLLSDTVLEENNIPVDGWTTLNADNGKYSFSIKPQNKVAVYVRITDEGGNVTVINSDGIVVYEDSEAVDTEVTYTYKENSNKDIAVEFNGNTVKSIVCSEKVLAANSDYSVDYESGKIVLKATYLDTLNAGDYTYTVSYDPMGVENSGVTDLTTTFTVKVEPTSIAGATVNVSATFTYDGNAKTPDPMVVLNGETLVKDRDYTVSYAENVNAGTATVTVTGKGNYSGTKTATFSIAPMELDETNTVVTLDQDTFVYDGTEHKPAVTVTFNGATLTEGVDYRVFYSQPMRIVNGKVDKWFGDHTTSVECVNVDGDYYAVVVGLGNFRTKDAFTLYANFVIEKATVTEPTIASKPYTGSVQMADITDTELYTVVENNGGTGVKLNGYYDVVLKLKDSANYKWSTTDNAQVTLPFAITRAENEWAVTPSIDGWTYGKTANEPVGEAKFGEASVEYSGTTNGGAAYSSLVAPTEAGSYKATFTVQETEDYSGLNTSVDFTIAKADQVAPTGLTKTDTTYFGKADGKISGLTSAMEFRKEGDSSYTAGFNGTLEYLAAGTYYVRYQGDANHNPSPDAVVTVNAGRKLQIVVPQNQVGYTVTVNKTEMEYEGSYTLKVEIHEGYTATEDFKIIISNWECGQQAGVEETYMNAIADQIIEVWGVADITPPVAEIKVKENKWTSFWNNLTFGLFFKETQDVTITTTDKGSGVKSIQYYLSNGELELDEVKAISDWVDYNGTFKIDPNNRYVVYAKITDHAGNILYINSDGIVLDNIAPTLEGIEDGKTYYGDLTVIKSDEQFYDIKMVTLDGEPMGFAEGTYGLIPADNAEHIVVVEDHAGNKTTYTVTVMKNYTVTYKADGEPISTETVGHGKDAKLPAVPAKNGYVGKWDSDGKNISGDTTITVVYTEIPVVKLNEVKSEDETDLEYTKKQLEDMLKDDSYTDEDKKNIQDAIDDIDDALEVIGNVEAVEESIVKLPAVDTVKPDDEEAIKAITDAQTAYNALSDYEKSLVDEAAKANLDKLVAALVAYDIVEGDGSSWREDSNHNITFVVNGLFSKFVGIKVDGKDVDKANYEVKAGSTIITLKASYLDTLAVGERTITVVYTDGSTDGTFNVHAKANSPATGDNSHMFLWIALLFISGGAVITLTVVDRKRRMASNR